MCPLWRSVTVRGWQAKLLGHAEGCASSFWATQSRLPFGLHGVEEFVFAMPGEIVGAARHWPAKELALKVLHRVSRACSEASIASLKMTWPSSPTGYSRVHTAR